MSDQTQAVSVWQDLGLVVKLIQSKQIAQGEVLYGEVLDFTIFTGPKIQVPTQKPHLAHRLRHLQYCPQRVLARYSGGSKAEQPIVVWDRPQQASVCGLKLLVYEALSF